jgi:hypothetical protein
LNSDCPVELHFARNVRINRFHFDPDFALEMIFRESAEGIRREAGGGNQQGAQKNDGAT